MNLRPATEQDLSTISSILTKMDTDAFKNSDIEYLRKILSHQDLYVVIQHEEIIWVVVYRISEQNCEIVTLCAKDERSGFGRYVIEHIETICREQQIPKLWCRSFAEYGAQGFYEKMWFEEQYLLKQQFSGHDTWFFWKVID